MSQRNQIIIVVVLGIVLVGVLTFQFTRKPPSAPAASKGAAPAASQAAGGKSPTSPAPAAATPPPAAPTAAGAGEVTVTTIKQTDVDIDSLLAGIKEVDFDYDQNRQSRDPMAALVGKVANMLAQNQEATPVTPATVGQVLNKTVSGIVWDQKYPVAIVDDDVVYPGYEYADGTVVSSIERDRVVFKVGDSPIEVKLKEL